MDYQTRQKLIQAETALQAALLHIDSARQADRNYCERERARNTLQGPAYMFAEIPQGPEGDLFVNMLRKYLNRSSYTMRIKGQHAKPGFYANGNGYAFTLPMEESTHMRVYLYPKTKA